MATVNNQVNHEALDRRVKNLIDDAKKVITKDFIPHLITLRREMIELRRDMWPHRHEAVIRDHRADLYRKIGEINNKIEQINKAQVATEVSKASQAVKEAQLQMTSPHPTIEACCLVAIVIQLARRAIAILDNLKLDYYLQQYLAEHQKVIDSTRRTAEELTNRKNVLNVITRKQKALCHAARRLAAEVLHEQQLELARKVAKARPLLNQFQTAIKQQDLELAERLYHSFEAYGPKVHTEIFDQDPAMQLRRMIDQVRGLKEDWFGRKVRQL